ncbi:hypothetical protein [Spiroplasma endosymbiont of Polydrusus formosus]
MSIYKKFQDKRKGEKQLWKILSLLNVLTISRSTAPTTIAASYYQKIK